MLLALMEARDKTRQQEAKTMTVMKIRLVVVAVIAFIVGVLGTTLATSAPTHHAHHQKAEQAYTVALLSCGVHVDGHTTSSGNWSIHATSNPCNRAYRAWANFICYGNGFKEGVNRIGQAVKGHNYSYARPRCPSALPNHVLNEGGFETYHDGSWHGPYCIVGCPVRAKDLSRGT